MSGIAAFCSSSQVSREMLESSVNALRYGNDEQVSTWYSEDRRVAFAQIGIPEVAGVALRSEDGNLHLVSAGHLYGTDAIKEKLRQHGRKFLTEDPAEIILHLYDEYGPSCLKHIDGEFSFILWDERNRLCFAARDRFGTGSLVYSKYKDTLYVGSRAKVLFAAGVPAIWDQDALFQFFHIFPDQEKTLFKGVFNIPAGHYLVATEDRVTVRQYWDSDYAETSLATDAELIEEFQRKFDLAVRKRTASKSRIAYFLSGGIDSTAIITLAVRAVHTPLDAFTITFSDENDDNPYNEYSLAKETAAIVGANLTPISIARSDIADNFGEAVTCYEQITIDSDIGAALKATDTVKKLGFRSVMMGEGSDAVTPMISDVGTVSKPEHPILGLYHRTFGFTPRVLADRLAIGQQLAPFFSDELILGKLDKKNPALIFLSRLATSHNMHQWPEPFQCVYLRRKTAQTLFGLSVLNIFRILPRVPFLDFELFDFLRGVPASLAVGKKILRDSMKPFVRDEVRERPHWPFSAPPRFLDQKDPFHALTNDMIRGSSLKSVPFLNHQAIVRQLDRIESNKAEAKLSDQLEAGLNIILSLCFLQEKLRLTT